MLSAAHWALLDDASGRVPPAEAAPSAEAAAPQAVAPPEAAARVDFWMTWDNGAAALPAEGTSERDAFLHALRRDVADWLASAAPDAPALHLKVTQVATRKDGTLAVRFRLSVPAADAGSAPDAQASRRLLDVRGAVTGAASSAQAHAEAAVDSLAAKMRRNSLPAPVGPLLRALGRGRISGVAVDDARSKAAAPAPSASEPEPEPAASEALPVASATSAPVPVPAPAPREVEMASAPAPAPATAHADSEALRLDKGAEPPVSPPARHRHASPPAVLLVVAALSAMLLGLGALLCCAALAWRRRRLPAQAAVAQRAWLQGWHAARMQGGKQIPVLELLGAPRDDKNGHASQQ